MEITNQTLRDLLKRVLTLLDVRYAGSQAAMARDVPMSAPTVSRTINPDSSYKPETRYRNLKSILSEIGDPTKEEIQKCNDVNEATLRYRASEGTKTIPRLEVQVSAGDGTYITQTDEVGTYSLDQEDAPTGSNGLFSVQIKGDSMAPEFLPGSWVVCEPIDAALPQFDAVYLFRHEDLIQIKRLQRRRPNQIHVISSNESYPPYVIRLDDATDFELLARVVRSLKHY